VRSGKLSLFCNSFGSKVSAPLLSRSERKVLGLLLVAGLATLLNPVVLPHSEVQADREKAKVISPVAPLPNTLLGHVPGTPFVHPPERLVVLVARVLDNYIFSAFYGILT